MPRRALSRLAPLVLATALTLTACGGDEEPSPAPDSPSPSETSSTGDASPEATETPEDPGAEITVTREGGTFTPNGERVELEVGESLALTITSDTAGELHVHSTPEQEIAYDEGTSEHEITIDRPGVVEVENHDPVVIVLQLEVR